VVAKGKDNDKKVITSPEFIFDIDATLVDLVLTSDESTDMTQGETANATATAEYKNGSKVAITANASLKSSNENVMTVNATSGLITAVAGTTRGTDVDLEATCDSTTKKLPLKVFKPDIRTMEIIDETGIASTESLQVRVGADINPRIKVTYAGSGIEPEIYTGNDVAWKFSDNSDFDEDKITIDGASGVIEVDASLVLTTNLILTVEARITKIGGDTEVGSDGNELKDTIKVTIKP
jgi:ribosomal protein L21E